MRPKDSKLSDEELMAIVEEQEPKSEPEVQLDEWTDVEKFIKKLQVVDGDETVPFFLIYDVYQQTYKRQRKFMSYNKFFERFSWYFEKRRTSNGWEFYIEEGIFDTSKENLRRAIFSRARKRERKKRQKEKSK